jgi:hypothetical protein
MAHHRDRVTNLNEVEWLITTGGVVLLLVIEIIEDGKEVGCSGIARTEAGKRPQSPSPSALKLTEFIVSHFSRILIDLISGSS